MFLVIHQKGSPVKDFLSIILFLVDTQGKRRPETLTAILVVGDTRRGSIVIKIDTKHDKKYDCDG